MSDDREGDPDYYKCRTCGEYTYRKDEHTCPGGLDDHDTRLNDLEENMKWLKGRVADLEKRLTEAGLLPPDFRAFYERNT